MSSQYTYHSINIVSLDQDYRNKENSPGYMDDLLAYISTQTSLGSTDGNSIVTEDPENYTYKRVWTSETTAREFLNFVKQLTVDYSLEYVSLTIEPIV